MLNIFKSFFFNKDSIIYISKEKKLFYTGTFFIFLSTFINYSINVNNVHVFLLQTAVIIGILFIFHFAAKYLFKGKSRIENYYTAASNMFLLYLLTLIPLEIFNIIIGLWVYVLNLYIIYILHKISKLKTIVIGLIPIILFIILI